MALRLPEDGNTWQHMCLIYNLMHFQSKENCGSTGIPSCIIMKKQNAHIPGKECGKYLHYRKQHYADIFR